VKNRSAVIAFIIMLSLTRTAIPRAEGSSGSKAYALGMTILTDSDWSLVDATGLGATVICEHEVERGGEASENRVTIQRDGVMLFTGKEAYDRTPVEITLDLLVVDPDEEVEITVNKGHIGSTLVNLQVWDGGGFRWVAGFAHRGVNWDEPETNPAYFVIEWSKLGGFGMDVDVPALPEESQDLVLAFHYPWYGSEDGPSGAWIHWEEPRVGSIASSAHYPARGPYDSRDQGLIEEQIGLARAAGIDGFVSSWWGPGSLEDEAFGMLLEAAEDLGFKATIYYESVRAPRESVLDALEIALELEYALEAYSGSGAFLEAWGRPVVFVYSAEAHGRGPGFWEEVRSILEERWGEVVLIGDYRSLEYTGVFDGVHAYIELDLETAERLFENYAGWKYASPYGSFDEALGAASEGGLRLSRRITCGTVVPGYDDRKIRSPGQFLDRGGGLVYGAYWDAVEAAQLDWVLITSWNEWHEGTEIEPSVEEGSLALRLTAERSAAFKGNGVPTVPGVYLVDHIIDDKSGQSGFLMDDCPLKRWDRLR